jgi:hypothetical protein
MLARKALLKPKNTGLKPQATGGKLFLPGFHRTRQESAAASIIIDSAKPGRTGLYGPGFYMTRTYANQARRRMIGSYGKHLVRCRVDVSRFICFDRAAAKRVWGAHHTLAEQLAAFGPWGKDEQKKIEDWSKALSAFWEDRKSKDAVYETGMRVRPGAKKTKYNSPTRAIEHSADIARLACDGLHLFKKVPGIMYTGSNDGACVLAYKTARVSPVVTALVEKERTKIGQIQWISATDRRIRRLYAPDEALRDDIKTYTHRLTVSGQRMTTAQKIALIENSYKQLPADGHDRVAFCVALLRVCRHASLHETRDAILGEFAASITHLLKIDMPCFIIGRRDGRTTFASKYGIKEFRVHVFAINDDDDDDDEIRDKAAQRYMTFLKRYDVLWDFIRYHVFLNVAGQHRVFLKEAIALLEAQTKIQSVSLNLSHDSFVRCMGGIFGAVITQYGEIETSKPKPRPGFIPSRFTVKREVMDGIMYLQEILSGARDAAGYKRDKPSSNSAVLKKWRHRSLPYKLIGEEEYVQFMRSQILKIYDALRKHPAVGKHPAVKKVLADWYRSYGKAHKAAVKTYDAYDAIGGKTLEPMP